MDNSGHFLILFTIIVACACPVLFSYMPELRKEVIVGIDLGTTLSVAAICLEGEPQVVPLEEGGRNLMPSYVHFPENGKNIIGERAKALSELFPETTVFDAKRLIGRTWEDEVVEEEVARLPFKLVPSECSTDSLGESEAGCTPEPLIKVRGQQIRPLEISSMVLAEIKDRLERWVGWRRFFGWRLRSATISIPANFNLQQQMDTLSAARSSGLRMVQLITEPAAAALAYRLDQKPGVKYVLVFDFGGGTLDVALLLLDKELAIFNVIGTSGEPHLGGEDVDRVIIDHLVSTFQERSGYDLRVQLKNALENQDRALALARIRQDAERLKIKLSSKSSASVKLDSLYKGKDLSVSLTKQALEAMFDHLIKQAMRPVRDVLEQTQTNKDEVGEIVLVGGSSRIPMVRKYLEREFEGFDISINNDINPDTAIAKGAVLTRVCK